MGSVKANSIKSENISVFRVAIALCLSLYFHNVFLYVLIALFLLSFDFKETVIYLMLLAVSLLVSHYLADFMNIGIIDFRNNNYYIVDKLFYKVALYTDEELGCGQIISCCGYSKTAELSFLKKNIIFTGNEYVRHDIFLPRLFVERDRKSVV